MSKVINQERVRTWEAVGGACCFVAGILAAFLGSVLTASGWILGAELHPWIHAAGSVLLIVTIPLILFAGFCLDWAERRPTSGSDPGQGQERGSPEPIVISKEIKRSVQEAGVTNDNEISLVACENGNGDRASYKTGLKKSVKTRGERYSEIRKEIESLRSPVGKQGKETV